MLSVPELVEPAQLLESLASRCEELFEAVQAAAVLVDPAGSRVAFGGGDRLTPLVDDLLGRLGRIDTPRRFSRGQLDSSTAALWIPLGREVVVGGVLLVGEVGKLPDASEPGLLEVTGPAHDQLRIAYELRVAWFRGDRMTLFALRRMVDHWIGAARSQAARLWIALLRVDGLVEVNRQLGMAAGDEAFAAATSALASRLPSGFFAPVQGAAAGALFIGDPATELLDQAVSDAEEAVKSQHDVRLHVGFASTTGDCGADELVDRATAALEEAREGGAGACHWHAGLDARRSEKLPDLSEVHGFEYQRIVAVWRLFDALTDNADLDELLRQTLTTVTPVLAAERASLWTRAEDDSWSHQLGDDEGDGRALDLVVSAAGQQRAVARDEGGIAALAVPLPLGPRPLAALHFTGTQLRSGEEHLGFVARLADQIGKVLEHRDTLEWAFKRRRATEDRLREQTRALRRMVRNPTGLVGSSPVMRDLLRRADRAAATNVPVLITGETGTGKEVAARMIHRQSRRGGPFVVVDCGAIPANLLESELFGHERGAFTGADSRKIGRFEQSRGGTLFLDEIGELPLELQPKLLRVLQEAVVRRIGGSQEIKLDLRLIAATHRDLGRMVKDGTFREDLFFRLRVIELKMPPVRERGDDVILLAYYFLRQYCYEMNRDFLPLSPEAEEWLAQHRWPGNVRELQNVLRRAVALVPGPEITASDLNLGLSSPGASAPAGAAAPRGDGPASRPEDASADAAAEDSLAALAASWLWNQWGAGKETDHSPLKAVQSLVLRALLQRTGGNLARAAELLGTSPTTVSSRLAKLGHPELSRSLRDDPFGIELERQVQVLEAPGSGAEILDEIEGVILDELFLRCRGNKSKMARILGVSRQTLSRKINR